MLVPKNNSLAVFETSSSIRYLTEDELNRLILAYQRWFEEPKPGGRREARARHWVIFLFLRYTGARVSEILAVDDIRDIDFREGLVRVPTLKRHSKKKHGLSRQVPIPPALLGEYGRVVAEFPTLRGKLFKVSRVAVFNHFKERAKEAGLLPELRHPHVLRHTRAIELLRGGVPVTVVQDLLGHAALNTTAMYLRFSGVEVKQILKDRGFLS